MPAGGSDELARVRNDPRGFVASLRRPAIIDEIQNAPDLFNYRAHWWIASQAKTASSQGSPETR